MYFSDLQTEVKVMMGLVLLVVFFAGVASGTVSVQDDDSKDPFSLYDLMMSYVIMIREFAHVIVLIFGALVLKSML